MSFLIFTVLWWGFVVSSAAITLPIRRDTSSGHSTSVPFKSQTSANGFNFTNEGDVFYAGTIIVDGQSYVVCIVLSVKTCALID